MDDGFPPTECLELDDPKRALVDRRLGEARALVQRYVGVEAPGLPSPALLEQAYEGWRRAEPEGRRPVRETLEAIGIALGEHLTEVNGLAWAVIKDETGSDLAIYGAKVELLVYPLTLVRARFESGEALGLGAIVEDITRRFEALCAAWDDDG